MEYLYAPWREDYIKDKSPNKKEAALPEECVFCKMQHEDDMKDFIIYRAQLWFVTLNKFPYNPGHMLIIPYDHKATFTELSKEMHYELSDLIHVCILMLEKTIEPQGINLGMNVGKAAGAGIPSHIHQHIVPRWIGDTSFLPVLAQTKHISCDLHEIYKKLHYAFSEYYKK